jgi:hypothetical protein
MALSLPGWEKLTRNTVRDPEGNVRSYYAYRDALTRASFNLSYAQARTIRADDHYLRALAGWVQRTGESSVAARRIDSEFQSRYFSTFYPGGESLPPKPERRLSQHVDVLQMMVDTGQVEFESTEAFEESLTRMYLGL